MNSSSAVTKDLLVVNDISYQFVRFPYYIGFGSTAIFVNILIIVILVFNRKLLAKSAFFFGLATGNIFVGLAFFVWGVYRDTLRVMGLSGHAATVLYCLLSLIPEIYTAAMSLPEFILVISSLERLIAVTLPNWYHSKWTHKNNWFALGVAYTCSFVSIFISCVVAWLNRDMCIASLDCFWDGIMGKQCTIFFHMLTIFCGIFSVTAEFEFVFYWTSSFENFAECCVS